MSDARHLYQIRIRAEGGLGYYPKDARRTKLDLIINLQVPSPKMKTAYFVSLSISFPFWKNLTVSWQELIKLMTGLDLISLSLSLSLAASAL